MSELATYDFPHDHDFVRWGSHALGVTKPWLAVNCSPGEWVEHKTWPNPGKGLLIANGDDFITILWSIQPSLDFDDDVQYFQQKLRNALSLPAVDPKSGRLDLRYNPLSVQEDIWIPVRLPKNERRPR